MPRELDLPRLFRTLERHSVSYVLIGGLAAVIHGSPFPTEDADITPDAQVANLGRLSAALAELDARVRTEGEPDGLPLAHDATSSATTLTWNLTTAAGDLNISMVPDGTRGFADVARGAEPIELYGVVIRGLPRSPT